MFYIIDKNWVGVEGCLIFAKLLPRNFQTTNWKLLLHVALQQRPKNLGKQHSAHNG